MVIVAFPRPAADERCDSKSNNGPEHFLDRVLSHQSHATILLRRADNGGYGKQHEYHQIEHAATVPEVDRTPTLAIIARHENPRITLAEVCLEWPDASPVVRVAPLGVIDLALGLVHAPIITQQDCG